MADEAVVQQQQETCPPGCCNGTEILCVSIPCPINIVLLGLRLRLELPCVRLTSIDGLTPQQATQLLQALISLLTALQSIIPTTPL